MFSSNRSEFTSTLRQDPVADSATAGRHAAAIPPGGVAIETLAGDGRSKCSVVVLSISTA